MHRTALLALTFLLAPCTLFAADPPAPDARPITLRIGIIGCDTSHVGAFTKIFNDPKSTGDYEGMRVVAAFPGGSKDIPDSADRLDKFVEGERKAGVEIVDSIPKLLEKVDAVLLESVDGRPHLEQVRPVLAAGKPVFIDKPMAGSLADAVTIYELGKKYNTPWFSSSSTRFGPTVQGLKGDAKVGPITGAFAWSPASLEKNHPDLYWYGIHGCELLYATMGPGCESVVRTHTPETDIVTGTWKDGRIGTFRGNRAGAHDYGFVAFGAKSTVTGQKFEGYKVLTDQIAHFFKTKQVPFANEETIELMAFMEAADESKRQNGAPVKLETVLEKARAEAKGKIAAAQ
jgi:predicted dehydrogenase